MGDSSRQLRLLLEREKHAGAEPHGMQPGTGASIEVDEMISTDAHRGTTGPSRRCPVTSASRSCVRRRWTNAFNNYSSPVSRPAKIAEGDCVHRPAADSRSWRFSTLRGLPAHEHAARSTDTSGRRSRRASSNARMKRLSRCIRCSSSTDARHPTTSAGCTVKRPQCHRLSRYPAMNVATSPVLLRKSLIF